MTQITSLVIYAAANSNIITMYIATLQIICMRAHNYAISLSTLVLNSRDWSEIVWLPEISCFKINLAIGFIRKNPLECIG